MYEMMLNTLLPCARTAIIIKKKKRKDFKYERLR